jgi:hypothetical protein
MAMVFKMKVDAVSLGFNIERKFYLHNERLFPNTVQSLDSIVLSHK